IAAEPLRGAIPLLVARAIAGQEVVGGLHPGVAETHVARELSPTPGGLPALAVELGSVLAALRWTPGLGLGHTFVLTWGILVLSLGLLLALAFAHVLRTSARGFDLRTVGSNPLAAVAAGVDVDLVQLSMLAAGGACAGLAGALQLGTDPAVALERWPLPLAFAGITIALYGLGSVRGVLIASVAFALWLN